MKPCPCLSKGLCQTIPGLLMSLKSGCCDLSKASATDNRLSRPSISPPAATRPATSLLEVVGSTRLFCFGHFVVFFGLPRLRFDGVEGPKI